MFDPNEQRAQCETYLSRFLQGRVNFIRAEMLPKSTRNAPWRLDVEAKGGLKSYVLRLDAKDSEREYQILRAMESIPIPTPCVYGWDPAGDALGVPCFFCDYIEGESLLRPMLAGETWAEELYLDTVCALQRITKDDLGGSLLWLRMETAIDVLENAHEYFQLNPRPLATSVYGELTNRIPQFPEVRFSNGDMWLDNFLVRDKQLAGVIDFEGREPVSAIPFMNFCYHFLYRPHCSSVAQKSATASVSGMTRRYCCGTMGWSFSIPGAGF